MSAVNYASLIVWVWEKLESYIKGRKAGEKELRELQQKLVEAVKTAHDSSMGALQYLGPLIATTEVSTCVAELRTVLSNPVEIVARANPRPREMTFYSGAKSLFVNLQRRLLDAKQEIEKIYEPREDYEKAIGHISRALTHYQRGEGFFQGLRLKHSLEELNFLDNETGELKGFLERKLRDRMKPIIDTYNLLSK